MNAIEFDKYFVILPSVPTWDVAQFIAAFSGIKCPDGFRYNSGSNDEWLTVEDIRSLISSDVDARCLS
jgi:hypothetical protein